MTYREALAWLYGTQRFGIKLGLENARRLFAALQILPVNARVIHVAGTNGKGSVCAMAAAICRAAGCRTGLFTSPHLITFRERIQVNGELIGEFEVATGLSAIRDLIADWSPHPTFFEITTALALAYFRERSCEIITLETGLGGRLDATNVVTPSVSVITPIDLDHQAWLGNTIEEIATEKAGIIKPHVPVISATQCSEAEAVIRARAAECEAPLQFVSSLPESFEVSLAGAHQKANAALAIAAVSALKLDSLNPSTFSRGLRETIWPARFERINERILVDGAHNPAGARVLVQTWKQQFGERRATLLIGMLRDKDAPGFWEALREIAARVFLPQFRSTRALAPDELRLVIKNLSPDMPVVCTSDIVQALDQANRKEHPILVTGSLHFAGEALAVLRGEPAAYEECVQ